MALSSQDGHVAAKIETAMPTMCSSIASPAVSM